MRFTDIIIPVACTSDKVTTTENIMANRIRGLLDKRPGNGDRHIGVVDTNILQRLMLAWGVMPKRRFPRHPGSATVGLLLPTLPFRAGCNATSLTAVLMQNIKLTRQLENTGSFAQHHFSTAITD